MEFPTPPFHVHPTGWGPTTVPEQYLGVPFSPFGKGERLGKAADFAASASFSAGLSASADGEELEPGEAAFELVDNTKSRPSGGGLFRGAPRRGGFTRPAAARDEEPVQEVRGKQAKYLNHGQQQQGASRFGGQGQRGGGRGGASGGMSRGRIERETREPSVKIETAWKLVDQFDLAVFSKMTMTPPKAMDITWCGSLRRYNDEYDQITCRTAKKLSRFEDVNFVYVTTLEDPVLETIIEKKQGNVFATDELMAYLMTCTRSQLPWDIIFTRVGNMLFIDKRDDSNLELLTVNENSTPLAKDVVIQPYNEPDKLRIEATAIQQNFLCQVLKAPKDDAIKTFENQNPFEDDDEPGKTAPIAYRYRKWQLGDNILVARTELHGFVKRTGDAVDYATIYALNEWDSKLSSSVDWRQKIDSQGGAVLATELRNNNAKISRWTAQSLLSGADVMKIGFVSRLTPRDPVNHAILKTQFYNPRDFAVQINLSQNNMWGILKSIIDFMMKQKPGKYLMMRDPNKQAVRIFEVPMNSFESANNYDEGEE